MVMGGDDDIAASLPRPPFPAPARREAAIEEALRRFDGGSARPPVSAGRQSGSRPPGWRVRPYAAALAGALLVALVAVPAIWMSPGGRSVPPGGHGSPGTERARPDTRIAALDAVPSEPAAAASESAIDDSPASPAGAAKGPAQEPRPTQLARNEPPPPPPPGGLAEGDSRAFAAREPPPAPGAAPGKSNIIVTGSRIARQEIAAARSGPDSESGSIMVTGSRVNPKAARRGDWNACTVDDPRRSLDACRRLADPAARGAAGRANARLSSGLALAWEGDFEGAIAAFGQAIEIAPRSSSAYLNRGLARRRGGDLDGALADLDRAVRYAPSAARTYYNRSLVLRQKGDVRRARADEARAVELDEDYADLVK
jgi:tetratricopeptide (TPR) repeat protein